MHTRHERVFDWLVDRFPFGKLYGPYSGNGRVWYHWMARGPCLREQLVPFLDQFMTPTLRSHVYQRYIDMKLRYRITSGDGTIRL